MNGRTEPRVWTPPLRDLTEETTLGFACIEYAKNVLGKTLYPWQEWALVHMLEIVGDLSGEWHFRYRTVLILVSRQNGKTVLSEVLASFFLNVLCVSSVFGTSLSLDKAEEVWEAVVADQTGIPVLLKEWKRTARTNGAKKLFLTNGRHYKVGAPTRRAGRGDSNNLVMLDELREQRDWETWAAAAGSISADPNGMVVCFTNAGDPDSVVLRQFRDAATERITGKKAQDFGGDVDADTLALFEWSAPEGAAVTDLEALAQANPAMGYGKTSERALLADARTWPEAKFRSECMCQQVDTLLPQPFPDGAWAAGIDEASEIAEDSEIFYGIDMSDNRNWTAIGACGRRPDGAWHIEVVARRVGSEWAIDWFRERARRGPMKLAFQGKGAQVGGLAEEICTLQGIERCAIEGTDLPAGWGRFWDGIAASEPLKDGQEPRGGTKIYHLPQPVLDKPAKTMQLKKLGGGSSVPDRAKSPEDIAPLFACIMAFAAATQRPREEKKIYESAYANGAGLALV